MDTRKFSEWLIFVASLLIFAGGMAHSFVGWPALRETLAQAHVDDQLIGAIGIGWNFGGTAMAILGVMGIVSFVQLRRSNSVAWVFPFIIGGFYTAFGISAYVHRFPNPHFLAFIFVGVLLTIAALLRRRA